MEKCESFINGLEPAHFENEFEKLKIAEGYSGKENQSIPSLKSSSSGPTTRSKSAKGTLKMNRSAMLRLEKRKSMIPQSSVSTNDPSNADSMSIRSGSTTSRSGPIKSKIGSLSNISHKPGGGNVKIESRRKSFANVQSRCGSLANTAHTPGGGKVKIESKRISIAGVGSKIGSMKNVTHTPGGGNIKIQTQKLKIEAKSKIGSLDNKNHTPGGGNVKITTQKLDLTKVKSKCGSLENSKHTPKGGNVKIKSRRSDWSGVKSRCGTFDNVTHVAGGGDVKIHDKKLVVVAKAKCGTFDNINHIAGGGDVEIYDEKALPWKEGSSRKGSNSMGSVTLETLSSVGSEGLAHSEQISL